MNQQEVTVYTNLFKGAPRMLVFGVLFPTEEAAKKAAEGQKNYIGTFPVSVPMSALD